MKIGPLDIGIKILGLAALVVVVLMMDIRLVVANNTKRVEGFYSSRIPSCLISGTERDMADGISRCDTLLQVMGEQVTARLYKATFQHKIKAYDKAAETFRSIANDSSASMQHRAMATFGAGVSLFAESSRGGKQIQAAVEAGDWFVKALGIDPDLADAKVALCTAVEWRLSTIIAGKAAEPEAQAVLKQTRDWLAKALGEESGKDDPTDRSVSLMELRLLSTVEKGKYPPGLDGASQLYNVRGLANGRARKLLEAEQSFDAAQALSPRWDAPKTNQFICMVRLLPETDVKLSIRESLLNKYSVRVGRNPDEAAAACRAFAVAWFRTREVSRPEEYMRIGYPRALAILKRAYETRADAKAMVSAMAIMDERLFARGGVLSALSKDFLLPCSAEDQVNRWKGDAVDNKKKVEVKQDFKKVLQPIYQEASAMKALLMDCSKKVRLDAKSAIEVKLRLLACELLIALCTEAGDRPSTYTTLPQQALELKGQASDNPDVLKAYAHFMLRVRNYAEAGKALLRVCELGDQSEEMKTIAAAISAKCELIQPRPDKSGWFGCRPLVRATLWAPNTPGSMASGQMSIDGKDVEAKVVGSQILYLLPEARITDGKHTVKVGAVDGYGAKAELEFWFAVDKVSPSASVDPVPDADVKGPLPVWTVKLSDEGAGVDLASLQVRLNNIGTATTPCRTLLVETGVYQADIASIQVKRGDPVPGETFKLGSVLNLTPGPYELRVSFTDQAGNGKEQSWTFQVK